MTTNIQDFSLDIPRDTTTSSSYLNIHGIFLLIAFYMFSILNHMDQSVLAAALPSIQAYFNINNIWAGLLPTAYWLSYVIFYAFFLLVISYYSKPYLLMTSGILWFIISCICMITSRYGLLLYLRVIIAIGKACFCSVAPITIQRIINRGTIHRSTLTMPFYICPPLGWAMGLLSNSLWLYWLPEVSWRLRLATIPVLLMLALSILFLISLRMPQVLPQVNYKPQEMSNLRKVCSELFYRPRYLLVSFACMLAEFVHSAFNWWLPTIIQENEQKLKLACIMVVTTFFAVPLGQQLSNWGHQVSCKKINTFICCFSLIFGIIFLLLMFHAEHTQRKITFAALTHFNYCLPMAILPKLLLEQLTVDKREIGWHVHTLFIHICSQSSGSFLVGLISEYSSIQQAFIEIICIEILGIGCSCGTALILLCCMDRMSTLPLDNVVEDPVHYDYTMVPTLHEL